MASLCSLVTSKNIGQAVASNCPMLEQLAVTLPESDTDAALKASFLLRMKEFVVLVFRSYCSWTLCPIESFPSVGSWAWYPVYLCYPSAHKCHRQRWASSVLNAAVWFSFASIPLRGLELSSLSMIGMIYDSSCFKVCKSQVEPVCQKSRKLVAEREFSNPSLFSATDAREAQVTQSCSGLFGWIPNAWWLTLSVSVQSKTLLFHGNMWAILIVLNRFESLTL